MAMNLEVGSELDVIALMRERLPPYVVNCLLASGFDVVDVIMSMDVSDKPGNSIEYVEKFISEHYAGLDDYSNTPASACSLTPFVFPPGHKLRIRNFVLEVRKKFSDTDVDTNSKQKKRKQSLSASKFKKPKLSTDSDTDSESVFSVSQQIRTSIAKWIGKQSIDQLKSLKENKHFTVLVTNIPKCNSLSVCVKCNGCQTSVQLHHKDKSAINSPYLISNWTRHVKMCQKLKNQPDFHQQSLLGFLSPSSSTTESSGGSASSSYPSDETVPDGSLSSHDCELLGDDLLESPLTPQSDTDQVFLSAPLSAVNHQ